MFDYFYNNDNEQYLFLQMPVMLIRDDYFKKLSDSSKILYSLLLNRTSLSKKNNWTDEQGRVYIIYTIEEIMSDLNCWEQKANKAMKELKEIGLIKSVRQGLGKPNIIYVMNFATVLKYKKEPANPVNTQTCDFHKSGLAKITSQDLPESQSIYNDLKEIDFNNLISSHLSVLDKKEEEQKEKTDVIRYDAIPHQSAELNSKQKKGDFQNANTDESTTHLKSTKLECNIPQLEEVIKENIKYDNLITDYKVNQTTLDEVVFVMTSTIMTEFSGGYITMGDEKVPQQLVKSTFMKLTTEHITMFIDDYDKQTSTISKTVPYIRKSLYKTYGALSHRYSNMIHVDMPYLAKPKKRPNEVE